MARIVGRAVALGRRAPVADGRRGPAQRPRLRRRAARHRRVPADAPRRRQRRAAVARRPVGGGHHRQSARGGALPDRRRHAASARRRPLRSGQLGAVVSRQPASARLRHRSRTAAPVLPHRPRRHGVRPGDRRGGAARRSRRMAPPLLLTTATAQRASRRSASRSRGRSRRSGGRPRRRLEPRQHGGLRAARVRGARSASSAWTSPPADGHWSTTLAPEGVGDPATVIVADWFDDGRAYAYNYTSAPSVLFVVTGVQP